MQQPNTASLIKRLSLVIILIILLVAGYLIYQNLHFKVVSTTPKTSDMSIDSPYLKVNFNRQLTTSGLKLTSSPSIISSYVASGKTLTINLKYPLNSSSTYSITLASIADTKGDHLYNKTFNFKPKYVPYNALSTDQQKTMLQNQTNRSSSPSNIGFGGLDSLSDHGVTAAQISDFEKAVFKYSSTAKSVVIDAGSVSPVPHDPTSSSSSDSINFNLKIDDKSYKATVIYSRLTVLRLVLYDPSTGNQLYDSGDIK